MKDIEITFIIKALNEESNIAACIESCIREAKPYSSEIILVDSLSTDRTIAIAKQYPIKIVQFENKTDIGCGAAPQLGYQHAKGEYIYLLDGDMEICPDFIKHALMFLQENEVYAGVGGILVDTQAFSEEDKRRIEMYKKIKETLDVSHLGGGGLYRKSAIESVEYFSHQGLLAFEEAELGVRLSCAEWKMARINCDAVLHTSHLETSFQRLKRQWSNGRLGAHGTFIKSSFNERWRNKVFKQLWFVFAPILLNLFFLIFILIMNSYIKITTLTIIFSFTTYWFIIVGLLAIKKKSLVGSSISVITWNMAVLASLFVLHKKVKNPCLVIPSKVISFDSVRVIK